MSPIGLVGLLLVFVGTFVGGLMKGVSPVFLFSIPAAFLIVVGGAVGASLMSLDDASGKHFIKYIMKALKKNKVPSFVAAIEEFSRLADIARRSGALALEQEVVNITDPFMKKGIQMIVDGSDHDQLEAALGLETAAMKDRHKNGAKLMLQVGIFSPTFGIIGAVFGLIATLSNLNDPAKLGHGISAAFVATFWGVFLANGLFLPWSNRLGVYSTEEGRYRALVIEGCVAIQSGKSPREIPDILEGFLTPAQRLVLRGEGTKK